MTMADISVYQSTKRCLLFIFNDTAPTEIYPLSLHDALPISRPAPAGCTGAPARARPIPGRRAPRPCGSTTTKRSEEHTSELQSQSNLVCRLLLEKKNKCPRTHRPIYTIESALHDSQVPS